MIEVIALGGRTSFCEFPLWVTSGPRELPKQVCFEGETQPPLPQRTSRMGSPVNLVAEEGFDPRPSDYDFADPIKNNHKSNNL